MKKYEKPTIDQVEIKGIGMMQRSDLGPDAGDATNPDGPNGGGPGATDVENPDGKHYYFSVWD